MKTKKYILSIAVVLICLGSFYYFFGYDFDRKYQMRSIVGFMYVNAREIDIRNGETKEIEYDYNLGMDNPDTKKVKISVDRNGNLITYTVKEGPDDIYGKNLMFERKEEGNEISAICKGGTIDNVYLPRNCRT